MNISAVFASLAMGLGATASCLGICMPFLVPYIISKDDSGKKGLGTAVIFSIGRLLVYMTMALLFYLVFSELLNDVDSISQIKGFKYLPGILGAIIILYGIWTLLKLPELKICPARYAKGAVSVLMGMLIGSFICPPFIFMLVSNIEESAIVMVLSVTMFWVGSSVSIIILGAVSGRFASVLKEKKGREWVRNVCAFMLIFTGIWFIATVFINN